MITNAISVAAGDFTVTAPQTHYSILEHQKDFVDCSITNLNYLNDDIGFQLTKKSDGSFVSEGQLVSEKVFIPISFNNLVVSWNGDFPKGTYIRLEVQVMETSKQWSNWYEICTYGDFTDKNYQPVQKGKGASVAEDTLKLRFLSRYFRYRFTFITKDPTVSPSIRLICYSVANQKNRIPIKDTLNVPTDINTPKPGWITDLNIPYRSQLWEDKDIAWRCCHPTSLSMALEHLGTKLSTSEVCQNTWDPYNEMYGNWIFNAAYAGKLGYKSYVRYCSNFDACKEAIIKGYPALLSLKHKKGQLNNSPNTKTGGHVILLVGFTPEGNPICNDPASRKEETGHVVYNKKELERAWIENHSGAVVFVEKR